MKKIQILFAAVIMTAVFSAFTTKKPDTVYFLNQSGQFVEKTMAGSCVESTIYCEYIWTGLANPNEPQNPGNYEPQGDPNLRFQPSAE